MGDLSYEIDELNELVSDLDRQLRRPAHTQAYKDARFPMHYQGQNYEAKEVIDAIVAKACLDPVQSVDLSNLLKYALRCGKKPVNGSLDEGFEVDTIKAANYAHRLVTKSWI